MSIYRVLARLLVYPDAELHTVLPVMRDMLRADSTLPVTLRRALDKTIDEFATADLIDLKERYSGMFDRIRSLSLHMFEHVHSDSRERGPAMLDLVELYRRHGLDVTAGELPDYLPLFLEFLSTIDRKQADRYLDDASDILGALHDRLSKRESPYAPIVAMLLHLAGAPATPLAEEQEELTFAALDRAWEEAAVAFGPENNPTTSAGCDRAATVVARMNASAMPGE